MDYQSTIVIVPYAINIEQLNSPRNGAIFWNVRASGLAQGSQAVGVLAKKMAARA